MGYEARTLVEAITGPAAITDPDGRVLIANTLWSATDNRDLCPPEDGFLGSSPGRCGAHRALLEAVWRSTPTSDPALVSCRCDAGAERVLRVSALAGDDGAEYRLVTVTEWSPGERFLTLLSHEARTPVTTVVAAVELLRAQPMEQNLREILDAVHLSAQALETLIDRMLDLGKLESGRLHLATGPVEVERVLEDVVQRLQGEARGKGILLLAAVAPDLPAVVRGDFQRLRQVLDAVVGNAVKFTADGEVVVLAEADGDGTLVLTVSDTGPGIAAAQRARIFEPFTQADSSPSRSHEGAGLGLTVASRLVAAMGGEITVEDAPGGGALFRIGLPLLAVPHEARVSRPLKHRRIAVVAPSARSTRALSWLLTGAGAAPVPAGFATVTRPLTDVDTVVWCDDAHDPEALRRTEMVALAIGPEGRSLMISATDPRTGVVRRPGVLTAPLIRTRLIAALNQERTGVRGAPVTVPPLAGGRVLLAEDNDVNRTVFHRMIELMGVTCDTVPDGAAAVAAALGGTCYDVILMDVQMPGTDGLEATRQIRAAGAGVPILALTATVSASRDECLAAGMNGRLGKPITLPELRTALAPYLGNCGTAPPDTGDVDRLISRVQSDGGPSRVMAR
ncbi:MAG TPA: ATP-binding protein [Actinoplanes sp.]|nr:ATP-binding protein [Actinoplanes sp.]